MLNEELITRLTPTADDIWLNSMCQLKDKKITQTSYFTNHLPVLNINRISLSNINIGDSQNDRQIVAIRKYYIKNNNKDPFDNRKFNSLMTK